MTIFAKYKTLQYNQTWLVLGLGLWCLMPLSTIFIAGGGNWSGLENHRPVTKQD